MSSYWGQILHLSIYGESHGAGIGMVLDNLPPGQKIDLDKTEAFMKRRAPGQFAFSTPRKEADRVEILSGFYEGRTTGTPLACLIRNQDTRSEDYRNLSRIPRPGHADLTGQIRYQGANDPRGGGHFSGRLTAPICFAGALCRQILERQGIRIYARILEIAGIRDKEIDLAKPPQAELAALEDQDLAVLDEAQGEQMKQAIAKAKDERDSVGGIVQLIITGVPAGLGDPMFGGLEPRLASFLYGIPAVKALSFGAGFASCRLRGSENNDSPQFEGEGEHIRIRNLSNNAGGIDGGIANGMPIIIQIGIKPTASVSVPQPSVDLYTFENTELEIHGRHDPCIVPRAVPVCQAGAAVVLLDSLLCSELFDSSRRGGEEA